MSGFPLSPDEWPPTPTNILAIPFVNMTVVASTSEDWIESIKYLVGELDDNPDALPQLDLRGISFEMEVRRRPPDHEVILSGSTADGKLALGPPPDYGYLLILVPHEEMMVLQPGEYVADVRARDASFTRRIIDMDLTIVLGVTRP